MKILLVQPDYPREAPSPQQLESRLLPSYSLILLSELLANAGHQVRVLDPWSNWVITGKGGENNLKTGLQKISETASFDMVGISVYTALRQEALELAELSKKIWPSAKVVLGGPHPTRLWHTMLEKYRGSVDFILKGGADSSLPLLAENLAGRGMARYRIPGLAWLGEGGQVKSNTGPVINVDLSSLPPVKFADYFAALGESRVKRAYLMTARGCKLWCNYCSQLWKKALYHPPARAVEEARTLVEDFSAEELVVYDDCLGMNPAHSAEIFSKLSGLKKPARLLGVSHFKFLDKSWLEPFQRAGGYGLMVGLPTGSGKLRRKMNNYIEDEVICAGVELLRSLGLKLGLYTMVGFPGETPEDLAKTRELLKMISPEQVIATVYELKPGDILIEFGLKAEMVRESDYLNFSSRIINYMTEPELRDAVGAADFLETEFTKEVLLQDADPAWWILGFDPDMREQLRKKAAARI